jgi:hypothetical protein
MSGPVIVEVEEALGPGIDFELDSRTEMVGRRARHGGVWLGFDRAALAESDDGNGRRLPVLVAVPVSTHAGARLEVELIGAWRSGRGSILVGRVPGTAPSMLALARVAANVAEPATWLDRDAAEREALLAHQRHRERRSHARISDGRAWHAAGALPPELARYSTPHSAAEYSMARLPPRFIRGLEGLLDPDERLLYWIERPMVRDQSVVRRLRGGTDRRAALLLLTDRQLLWMIDHAQPDRYLSDWGVDVELLPVERLLEARCDEGDEIVGLAVMTPAGSRRYVLPDELCDEARLMRDLLVRFTPPGAGSWPRRRYSIEPLAVDFEIAARFGQEPAARALHDSAARAGEVLAFLFSPSRPGQRSPAALVLRSASIELLSGARHQTIALADVAALGVTLSPLIGRIAMHPRIDMSYPAPLIERGAAFVRLARRTLAAVG